MKKQVTLMDAPIWYGPEAADAWADGFNAGIEHERQRTHELLMKLHMDAQGKHNYYYVVANQLLEES